jgi:hypothetical protein
MRWTGPTRRLSRWIDKALACRDAEWKALTGGKPSPEACAMTEDDVRRRQGFGINVLPDGRALAHGHAGDAFG